MGPRAYYFLMIIAPLLAAALAASAPAQTFAAPEGLGAAVVNARQLGAGAPKNVAAFRAAVARFWAQAVSPINTGFQALGPAGKTGTVQGPPMGGDGTYRVIQNDPMEMVFAMKTGYVDGTFTLKRDAASGQDQLGFDGKTKDGPFSGWTPSKGTYAGQISYDAGSDSGTISWKFNGNQITDKFSGGRAGSASMTITLNGHSHTFTQD
jgi:hypothetical protein